MPNPRISQIPIYAISAPLARHACGDAETSPESRWHCCKISADIASALNIPLDDLNGGSRVYRVRICVTQADVNVLYNPGYLDFLGKSESFVVDGLAAGSQRVEIYANSGPGAKDGGVYKLYGGDNPFAGASVPTNARVSLYRPKQVEPAAGLAWPSPSSEEPTALRAAISSSEPT